jgi:predicted PurR-regulated permease PerM
MVQTHKILGYVPVAVLILLVVLSFAVLKEFITVIFFAALLSYILMPVKRFFERRLQPKWSAALVCMLMLITLLCLVLSAMIIVVPQVQSLVNLARESITPQSVCSLSPNICSMLTEFGLLDTGSELVYSIIEFFGQHVFTLTTQFIQSIPLVVVKLILLFMFLYFGLLEGANVVRYLRSLIPLKSSEIDSMQRIIEGMIFAVIYGSIFVVIIQGLLAMVGYTIAGAPSPILFGLLTILVAFIPFVGTALLWVPISLLLLTSAVDTLGIVRGVFLIVYSLLIVSTADNFIKPLIISKKAGVHPVLVFLGVLGGLHAFGVMGFLLGPVCLALLVAMADIVRTHYFSRKRS